MLDAIAGGLVVSCQAPDGHPLRSPDVIARLARCAALGGAVAVRVNGPEDVRAVKAAVDLPVIGLHKVRAADRYLITPHRPLVEDLAAAGADIIAAEATGRGDLSVAELVRCTHALGLPLVADVATEEQGLAAWAAGADLVATTLSGYTADSPQGTQPDLALVSDLAVAGVRTVAEGRLATAAHVRDAFALGAFAVVVGTAITDPMALTRDLVTAIAR
ncbi:N-acetylmannosamine-6-phosphate 2-epimerase [Dactylosporangium sp. McL0621]|uniref:N-acetylmannosamine-6-phosphate 2-epimerase n=1 Tax=Dactylosporangium sp. McL0621 TaxID=3415678 RepID=UPI003CF52475